MQDVPVGDSAVKENASHVGLACRAPLPNRHAAEEPPRVSSGERTDKKKCEIKGLACGLKMQCRRAGTDREKPIESVA